MKPEWVIPLSAAYLYFITILLELGFFDYFGVPPAFLDASLVSNVLLVHFFLGSITFLSLLGLVIISISTFLQKTFNSFSSSWVSLNRIIFWILISLAAILAYSSINIGELIARNTTKFYVPESGCVSQQPVGEWLIIGSSNGAAILIDAEGHKQHGGFIVKNLAEMHCKIQLQQHDNIEN